MPEITATERINMILADPAKATMTLAQIVGEEIKEFKGSEQYNIMVEAERYFRNRSDVQKKTNDVAGRSNTKIEHPFLRKFIRQKADYLLAMPWSVDTPSTQYADALNELFDQSFRQKIKHLGSRAVRSGIAYIQPYFDDGKLQFMRIPATELIPLWKDEEHTKMDAFIRFYEQTVYSGSVKYKIMRAEFWHAGGVKRFKTSLDGSHAFFIDQDYGTEANGWTEPHFMFNNKAYNWSHIPIAWLRYNEEELPLYYFIKELIDDVNWQTSVTSDVLRDIAKFIYILKNYGGQDLAEFISDLKKHLAIKVTTDGGVDKLQADLNIDAVMAFLDKQRRDLYDFAAAVDTKDPDLGNASGTAIHFRYMDLNSDCESLAQELQSTFKRLKLFIDVYFQIIGKGDFTNVNFNITFNADMPVNESEIVENVSQLAAGRTVASQRTLVGQLPFVKDVDEELKQITKERKEAMKEFGDGLFDKQFSTVSQEDANGGGDGVNGQDK